MTVEQLINSLKTKNPKAHVYAVGDPDLAEIVRTGMAKMDEDGDPPTSWSGADEIEWNYDDNDKPNHNAVLIE